MALKREGRKKRGEEGRKRGKETKPKRGCLLRARNVAVKVSPFLEIELYFYDLLYLRLSVHLMELDVWKD